MISRLRRASGGLAFRLALLLALALTPIGIIALAQTFQLIEESNRRAEESLLALTSKAAGGEEGLIRRAFGAAQAIGAFVPLIRDDPETCQTVLNQNLNASDAYSFAGYISADGRLTCASAGIGLDVSTSPFYQKMRDNPRPRTVIDRQARFSGTSVIAIMVPVMNGGVFDGYVIVSLPHRRLFRAIEKLEGNRPVDLVTFNDDGEVLTSESGLEGVELRLPKGRPLAEMVGKPQAAFTGITEEGERRVFAVVPVVSNLVYAIGSWKHERLAFAPGAINLAMPILFPILMWVACLAVAYLAIERLVIRPTRNLRARMLMFMRSRQITPARESRGVPIELREMDETWNRLAESVLKDEAELEDVIHDKNVLLREVHHRVKNNLQLIASILSMTIRKTPASATRDALTDVQNRVMSLATVHQNLQETSTQGRVRADELLMTIAMRLIDAGLQKNAGVKVDQEFQPTTLYPDQAVPLTLTLTEALTNSLKHIGKPKDGAPWITVLLCSQDDGTSYLEIANSLGEPLCGQDDQSGTGLGDQLIKAFAHQLGGSVERTDGEEEFRIRVTFPRGDFDGGDQESAM